MRSFAHHVPNLFPPKRKPQQGLVGELGPLDWAPQISTRAQLRTPICFTY